MADEMEWLDHLAYVADGRYFSTLKPSKNGEEIAEFGGLAFKAIQIDPKKPLFPVSLSTGRTISLGQYEFARIEVGVDAIGPVQFAPAYYKWAEAMGAELLAREVASAKDQKRKPGPLPDPPDGLQLVILRLQYGLTMSTGKFESAKADVGLSLPSSPDHIHETWVELEKFVSDRITQQVNKVRGKPSLDVGI